MGIILDGLFNFRRAKGVGHIFTDRSLGGWVGGGEGGKKRMDGCVTMNGWTCVRICVLSSVFIAHHSRGESRICILVAKVTKAQERK